MSETMSPIITALDFSDPSDALGLAQQLSPSLTRVKVGKELFTRAGPALVDQLQTLGFDVFLDLKFHDIPNTVAGAVRASAAMGVWMVNVHASGGRAMLEAAREAVPVGSGTQLIAVTVLTSMDDSDLEEVGVIHKADDQVQRLATLTADCELDGVVCSPRESALLRASCGPDFCLVTPGVRPAVTQEDSTTAQTSAATTQPNGSDQKRVMTPVDALKAGSDYLVIGRPITQSPNPVVTLEQLVKSIPDCHGATV